MSDNLDLNALRDIASAATKGPWTHTGNEDECGTILGAVKRKGSVRTYPHVIDLVDRREDGDFIAAFDPPTVLTLIDHIDHLRDAAQHAEIHAAEMRERAEAAEAIVARVAERVEIIKADAEVFRDVDGYRAGQNDGRLDAAASIRAALEGSHD